MTRNSIILHKKWTVPFTTDVEIGKDWTVPWDLSKMRSGKKEWCAELKPFFTKAEDGSSLSDQPKEEVEENTVKEPKGELPFYKYELEHISMKLVYEMGDKLAQCLGNTPLLLTHKGENVPMGITVKIDVPKFKELFE